MLCAVCLECLDNYFETANFPENSFLLSHIRQGTMQSCAILCAAKDYTKEELPMNTIFKITNLRSIIRRDTFQM